MTLNDQTISRRTVLRGAVSLAGAGLFGVALKQTVFAHNGHDATPGAASYPESVYTAKEYAFDGPVSLQAGFNKITFTNNGTMGHHAMFLKLNAGKTVADLATVKDLPGLFEIAVSVGGPGSIDAGQTVSVIVDLEAADYVVACIIPDEDGVPHMAKGMALPVTVSPDLGATASAPTEDAAFELAEYGFPDFPKAVKAGPQLWKITNVGAQLHEMAILKLADGVTDEQVTAIISSMAGPAPAGTPDSSMAGMDMGTPDASMAGMDMSTPPADAALPFVDVSGIAPISPKQTNYLEVNFDAGNYYALCFIPDAANGAPHFALGMAMPFTVS
jgi:hypothetical protein